MELGNPGGGRGRGRGRAPPTKPQQVYESSPPESASITYQQLQERYNEPTGQPEPASRGIAEIDHQMLGMNLRASSQNEGAKGTRSRGRGYRPTTGRGEEASVTTPGVVDLLQQYVGGSRGFEDPTPITVSAPEEPDELTPPPPQTVTPPGEQAGDLPGSTLPCPLLRSPERPPPDIERQSNENEPIMSVSVGTGSLSKPKRVEDLPPVIRRGTKGVAFNAVANFLRLKLKEGTDGIVEYHVSLSYPIESVRIRRKLLQQFESELGTVRSFDGMVLFLPRILRNDVTVLQGTYPNDDTIAVTVHITFIKIKPMKDSIVFFNTLLRRIMLELKYVELRREFYDLNLAHILTSHKMEIWPGVALTTDNMEDGLMICVDNCSRVLRTETVYDYYRANKNDPRLKEKFSEFIINKIVLTRYNNKCYKIDDVAWDMNPKKSFEFKKNQITFADYMESQYKMPVRDLEQPMLISKLKPRKDDKISDSNEMRLAALIPELCSITGLTEDQRADFKVMTDLATATRLNPQQRVENLQKFVNRLMDNAKAHEILHNWNLYIERAPVRVEGRLLDGPEIQFNARTTVKKTGPDFSREAGMGVYEPIDVKKYVVICNQRDADKAKRFIEVYKQVTGPLGIKMMQLGEIIPLRGQNPQDFRNALKEYCNPNELQFVVLIMPKQRDDVYGAIKRHCVADVPIPSQCILAKTLMNEKRLRSVVLKIALQVNCKLGGSLWALKMPLKEEIMFVGIDAAHDPLKKDKSVICLVASMNNECTKYYSRATTSAVHQELVSSLRPMMKDAMQRFRNTRGKFPDRVIVFRDGGSMGALSQIEITEMNEIKAAMDDCEPPNKVAYTFCVVTKRIPQRFFQAGQCNKYANPSPGSIFDNTVTQRHNFDFYVVSQLVRQGTVNPTHFIVLNTDDEIRPDLIQKLAYVTTFMYYNWSGTVRVPAMVQYAHKLAALLSRHVKAAPHQQICNTLYYL